MFNVNVEPKVLKILEKEGYSFEFNVNQVFVRTKDGVFSFGIIYKEDTYELLVFSKKDFCYVTSVAIEVDKTKKTILLRTQTKHNETTMYKLITCD